MAFWMPLIRGAGKAVVKWGPRAWRGIKGFFVGGAAKEATKQVVKKSAKEAAKQTAKRSIFSKGVGRLALLTGTGLSFGSAVGDMIGSVATTLTAPGFIVPALLGAAAGTYGYYKISKITSGNQDLEKKESQTAQGALIEDSEPVKLEQMTPDHIKQLKKLTPAQIRALRAKKYTNANRELKDAAKKSEQSKRLTPPQVRAMVANAHTKAA